MAPGSGSVAVTVVTAVAFSASVIAAVAPPPFEVMTGASLTLVTVTARAWVSVGAVGDLHGHVVDVVAAGIGRRFEIGAATKVRAPVAASMVNLAASAPPTMV